MSISICMLIDVNCGSYHQGCSSAKNKTKKIHVCDDLFSIIWLRNSKPVMSCISKVF